MAVMNEPVAEEYSTFAIQRCGGSFAEWRAANSRDDRLKFVFDNSSPREKRDIAKVFFAAANEQRVNGIEQWFNPDEGVSYENRRITNQLLSADMVAWTVASVRALQMFGHRGSRFVEAYWLAKVLRKNSISLCEHCFPSHTRKSRNVTKSGDAKGRRRNSPNYLLPKVKRNDDSDKKVY
jgi:hypothetical protein